MFRHFAPGLATAALLGLAALAPIGSAHAGPNGIAAPHQSFARSDFTRPYAQKAKHGCRLCYSGWSHRYYWYCEGGGSCPQT